MHEYNGCLPLGRRADCILPTGFRKDFLQPAVIVALPRIDSPPARRLAPRQALTGGAFGYSPPRLGRANSVLRLCCCGEGMQAIPGHVRFNEDRRRPQAVGGPPRYPAGCRPADHSDYESFSAVRSIPHLVPLFGAKHQIMRHSKRARLTYTHVHLRRGRMPPVQGGLLATRGNV